MANYATLIRRPWLSGHVPFRRATVYARIKAGTFPPPVKIGRMSAWPAGELASVNKALVQGVSDNDLRAHILNMVEERGMQEGHVRALPPLGDDEI